MHIPSRTLLLLAAVEAALAQPTSETRGLLKRQDWSKIDWASIFGNSKQAAAVAPAAPAPAPASAPAAAADSNSGTSNSDAKRGLDYNDQSPSLSAFTPYKPISWAANWDSIPFNLPSQYDYVPTLKSLDSQFTSRWAAGVAAAKASHADTPVHLLSFNEPDMPSESDMSPAAAAAAWKQYIAPYGDANTKLASPSVTNGQGINPVTGQPQGLDWLRAFLNDCSDCKIDYIPVHWYGCPDGTCSVADDVSLFKKQVQDAITLANGKPVWITEFSRQGDTQGQADFLSQVLPWLDSLPGVERYAYFMVRPGSLVDGSGSLNDAGKAYVS